MTDQEIDLAAADLATKLADLGAEKGRRRKEEEAKRVAERAEQHSAFFNLDVDSFAAALNFFLPEHDYGCKQPAAGSPDSGSKEYHEDGKVIARCRRCMIDYVYQNDYYISDVDFKHDQMHFY